GDRRFGYLRRGVDGLLGFLCPATARSEDEHDRSERDGGRSKFHRENPFGDGLKFWGVLSLDCPRGKSLASPLLWPGRLTEGKLRPTAGRLLSPATIRAYPPPLHVRRIRLDVARRAGRYLAPRGAARGCQPAADAGLCDRRHLRRPPRRAGTRCIESGDRAVRADDVVLFGPDRHGRGADCRRTGPPPPRRARSPPKHAHGVVARHRLRAPRHGRTLVRARHHAV